MVINLAKHQEKGSKVYSGRDAGETVRKNLELDKLDDGNVTITIKIPDDTFSVNSSFFLGLFAPSIRKLGESKFRKKYIFKCDELIMNDINDGIGRALRDTTALN